LSCAAPGDVVAIDLIELTPLGVDKSAILWDFGMLRREFLEPKALFSPVHDGGAWFGGPHSAATQSQSRHGLPMSPEGYKPYAGAYGGDFDQEDAGQGSRVYLPVLADNAGPRSAGRATTVSPGRSAEAPLVPSGVTKPPKRALPEQSRSRAPGKP
jgi:acetamidase/formamidase